MQQLLSALQACLRPLARILLSCGVGYREFSELAKLAFVQEAVERQKATSALINVSRLAVVTGLSRKELSRMRDSLTSRPETASLRASEMYKSQGARVMQLWHADHRFIDELGSPLELQFDGAGNSFTALVRLAGGDIPVGAVRAELLAAGAAIETNDGHLRAKTRHFIPAGEQDEVLLGLTRIVYPLLSGLARNSLDKTTAPFLQRVAYNTRPLDEEASVLFRRFARTRSIDFLETIDDWITAKEGAPGAEASTDLHVHLVGVFYFDGTLPEATDNFVRRPPA
jgi:hypothetical protein